MDRMVGTNIQVRGMSNIHVHAEHIVDNQVFASLGVARSAVTAPSQPLPEGSHSAEQSSVLKDCPNAGRSASLQHWSCSSPNSPFTHLRISKLGRPIPLGRLPCNILA